MDADLYFIYEKLYWLKKKHLDNNIIKTMTLQVISVCTKNTLLKCGVNF